jgi:hypothetical protein
MTFSMSSRLSSLDSYKHSTASRADLGVSGWYLCCYGKDHVLILGYIEINTWSFPYQPRYQFIGGYIEINTWSFPHQPRYQFFGGYIEINTWSFPYQPRYQFFGGYIEINTWYFPYQPRYQFFENWYLGWYGKDHVLISI